MKNFKFRAWDLELNKWASVASILFRPYNNIYSLSPESESRFIFQLFTSSADQTGQEIYEGDILNSKPNRWVVEYEEGCFKVRSVFGTKLGQKMFLSNIVDHSFLIGNIFETPEKLIIEFK